MQRMTEKTGVVKPYNIVIDEENNSASIDMYGEVVERRPVDFWTGKPVQGNFIALDEFLSDLDGLKTKNNITVHINSVGGDLYSGVAIYNRLKNLPGKITTINDGLAASAGSVIFMAGSSRKMNAGSNIMLHQAMGFLYGYYNNNDLKDVAKQLTAANKAGINIYAEATGLDPEAIKTQVDRETWLTGREAVEAGYATELIESDKPISMSLTADRSKMIVNGVSLSTRGMSNIPAGIPVLPANSIVSPAASAPMDDKNSEERNTDMELKNIEGLRAAFPDLVAQAEAAARAEGRTAGIAEERSRIEGIEAIENAIADKALITGAKYGENPLTAEQLAFKAMQAQAAIGASVLQSMTQDSRESGAEGVSAVPNCGPEEAVVAVDPVREVQDAIDIYNKIKNGGRK